MKTLGIIPARFASTRFPGKPLALLSGKPMIQWVWERVSQSNSLDEVIVATDDLRIAECVNSFGGQARITRDDHLSGTDRCAEVLASYKPGAWSCVLNIQGDEPFIRPDMIDQLSALMSAKPDIEIATLACKINNLEQLHNPNVVKLVADVKGRALYFSRHPIPFARGVSPEHWMEAYSYLQHIGLYGFRAALLPMLTKLPPGRLEKAESLEQLRWLENGYAIAVAQTEYALLGVDTPEDLDAAQEKWMLESGKNKI